MTHKESAQHTEVSPCNHEGRVNNEDLKCELPLHHAQPNHMAKGLTWSGLPTKAKDGAAFHAEAEGETLRRLSQLESEASEDLLCLTLPAALEVMEGT
jgi:hypothetical protein